MKDFNAAIGKRIRELRERHGLSREKLAELAKMNDKFLYEVETGRKGLSAYKMYYLSRSLGVTMDFLVADKQNQERYGMILSLLESFNDVELKSVEDIIRRIIEISRSRN